MTVPFWTKLQPKVANIVGITFDEKDGGIFPTPSCNPLLLAEVSEGHCLAFMDMPLVLVVVFELLTVLENVFQFGIHGAPPSCWVFTSSETVVILPGGEFTLQVGVRVMSTRVYGGSGEQQKRNLAGNLFWLSFAFAVSMPMLRRGIIVLVLATACTSPLTGQHQYPTSKFGAEWPTLKEVLEYTDETGDWILKEQPPSFYRLNNAPDGSRVQCRYDGTQIRFYPNGEFVLAFVYEATTKNRFMRVRSVEPTKRYIRRGIWKLSHHTPNAEEGRKIMGITPYKKTVKVYFLTLNFQNNTEATGDEKAKGLPVNGVVTLALSEWEFSKDEKTRLDFLNWLRVCGEDEGKQYKVDPQTESEVWPFPFFWSTAAGKDRVTPRGTGTVYMTHAEG